MSPDSMKDPVAPIGGIEDPQVGTVELDAESIPVPYGRDAQTDARSISEAAGQMSRELDMSGYQVDVGVESIAQEIRDQGWDKLAEPVGAEPKPISTSGGRGADDIGKL